MTDIASADRRRKSLTKRQLETELGAELLSLCQSVTSDGRLTAAEVASLREWIGEHSSDDLPAIAHLGGVLDRVLADGKITEEEFTEVYRALEAVLPTEIRKDVRAARRQVEQQERDRNRPIARANFMVAGVRYEGRPSIIRRYVNAGEPAILRRDKGNRHSRYAIAVYTTSGHQVGFMPNDEAKYWAPDMDAGAQVSAEFTTVLDGGRSPIPVVDASLFRSDATLEPEETTVSGSSSWLIWIIVIAITVAIVRCAAS